MRTHIRVTDQQRWATLVCVAPQPRSLDRCTVALATERTAGETMKEAARRHQTYNGPRNTFFDEQTYGPLQLELRRKSRGTWQLLRRFGYHDDRYDEAFICPHDVDEFETDLASIPSFLQWVVPARGIHFPAIMLHDALVAGADDPTHLGPPVDRVEADRIMRDAMKALGVGLIRRWFAWTGASVATAASALNPKWWWRLVLFTTFATIATLGVLATIDVFDLGSPLPWMGDRSTAQELANGFGLALAVSAMLSVLWGRLWRAGFIAGLAFAGLLHVTLIMVGFRLVYMLLEHVVAKSQARSLAEVAADQECLIEHMRLSAQVEKGSASYVDLRIPRSQVRVAVAGPKMRVGGLRLVTDLGMLEGHSHHALVELKQSLLCVSHCGPVGSMPTAITVEVDCQGAFLRIDAGHANLYAPVLEISTVNGETFEALLKRTVAVNTGRGFLAGLIPVVAEGHVEARSHDVDAGSEHLMTGYDTPASVMDRDELADVGDKELRDGHS